MKKWPIMTILMIFLFHCSVIQKAQVDISFVFRKDNPKLPPLSFK